MSLKGFHIVFVSVCSLLFAFLATWSFFFSPENTGVVGAIGYVSLAGLAAMVLYGIYFVRKARRIHL